LRGLCRKVDQSISKKESVIGQSFALESIWLIRFGWNSGVESTEAEVDIEVRVPAEWWPYG
jgi:hypothetical protein